MFTGSEFSGKDAEKRKPFTIGVWNNEPRSLLLLLIIPNTLFDVIRLHVRATDCVPGNRIDI